MAPCNRVHYRNPQSKCRVVKTSPNGHIDSTALYCNKPQGSLQKGWAQDYMNQMNRKYAIRLVVLGTSRINSHTEDCLNRAELAQQYT